MASVCAVGFEFDDVGGGRAGQGEGFGDLAGELFAFEGFADEVDAVVEAAVVDD